MIMSKLANLVALCQKHTAAVSASIICQSLSKQSESKTWWTSVMVILWAMRDYANVANGEDDQQFKGEVVGSCEKSHNMSPGVPPLASRQ